MKTNEYIRKCKHGIHLFFNNTYEFNFGVHFGDMNELKGHIDEEVIDANNLGSDGVTFYNQSTGEIIIHFSTKTPPLETISHEAMHAVLDVCKMRNILPDWDNQEVMAYLMSWFVRMIIFAKKQK